jgi:hypothetical protein
MLRCWTFSCTCTHTSCYAAGLSLALPQQARTTLRLKQKKELFNEALGTPNYIQFLFGETLDFPILKRPFHGILAVNLLEKNKHVQITTVADISTIIL